MPAVTVNGIEVETFQELLEALQQNMRDIYGNDINVDSNTPDGQALMIYNQGHIDCLDLIVQVYNSMNPDNAIGRTLDQRVSINGIQRQEGSYTVTPVTIVTNRALNLYGLDQSDKQIYTVADEAGNKWLLRETVSISAAGTYSLDFRAQNIGRVLTVPNTITIQESVVLGVVSVNNPSTYSQLGENEESDAELRLRRQRSVAISSKGWLEGLEAALENIDGVTYAKVYENMDSIADSDGVPAHSIWVVIGGTPDENLVAQAIYNKRNGGVNMKGDVVVAVVRPDATTINIKFDYSEPQDLFIKMVATSINGTVPPDIQRIRSELPAIFLPGVGAKVNVNELSTLVQSIDSNTLVTGEGFSSLATGPFDNTLSSDSKKNQFVVTSANIIILPMQIKPSNIQVPASDSRTFVAYGGFGAYTYSLEENNSGGSINSTTGAYTAGAVAGVDVVKAEDTQGNEVTTTVSVV